MAYGLIKGNTIIGIEAEVTEGTFVAPSAATSYLQPLSDGFELKPSREQLDRTILTASPGMPNPKMGIKSVSASLPVEFRASGVEGGDTDFGLLIKGALGATRAVASNVTSTTGHSSTVINMSSGNALLFAVGDIVLVKETAAHEIRPISAVGATSITLAFALTNGAPSASVVLSKVKMYYTAATGHPSLSLSYYWGNEIRQCAIGSKVVSMGLEGFETGKLAGLKFALDGLSYTEIDGVAPHTPTYDSGTPPIILSACVWRSGVSETINSLSVSVANTLGFVTSTCSENGKVSSRVTKREITGSFNPYKDDTTFSNFTSWNAGTEFSLLAYAYTPSASAGEITMGSVVAIWLPQCITTEYGVADQDGILTDQLGFKATRGAAGSSEEMYLGLI